jgi:hypothetical protein
MNRLKQPIVGLLLAFAVAVYAGDTNRFEMPGCGTPLPVSKFELVNHIPRDHVNRLPKELPIFRYSRSPRVFPIAGLQGLVEQSSFAGTNVAALLRSQTNWNREGIRLMSADRLDYFIVKPSVGLVMLQNTERGHHMVSDDSVPSFDVVRDRAVRFAELLGVKSSEMRKNEDGTVHVQRSDRSIPRMALLKLN